MKKTVDFSKHALNIFFHILTNCNLSCKHCYINKKQHGKNILPALTVINWLKIFLDLEKKFNIVFLGGEPTLHPELSKIIKETKKLNVNSITIDTNGYLFNDIIEKTTPDEVDFFSFSLDGATKETNDKLRGAGSYENCIKGIKKTIEKGFNTSLIYTVNNKNIHELKQAVHLVNDLKIKNFFIQTLGYRGNSVNSNISHIPRKMWTDIIPKIAEYASNYGITTTYPKVYLDLNESFECSGNFSNNFFIFPNSRVYRCPLCADYPINSLSIKKNKLVNRPMINEKDFFNIDIKQGCIMSKIIQPQYLEYDKKGNLKHKIACCMLKQEVTNKEF